MDRLPAEVLAGVLRRLPARDLAVCRSVQKDWRNAIDAGELLRSLRGIFINYGEYENSHLFSRPVPAGTGPWVDGRLDFMPRKQGSWRTLMDHCNGLLLYLDHDGGHYYVCNPATQRWGRLPWPQRGDFRFAAAYLVFDPAVSPHYEVVLLPGVPDQEKIEEALGFLSIYFDTSLKCRSQWPPPLYKMNVFSSRTGQWEERQFVREGEAVVTLADVVSENDTPIYIGSGPQRRYAEYWRGYLYIHCRGSYLTRLSLSDNKYKVVKTPTMVKMKKGTDTDEIKTNQDSDSQEQFFGWVQPYLGRSEKGVHFVEIYKHKLCIWILNESRGLMDWTLHHHVNLVPISRKMFNIRYNDEQVKSAWMLEDYYGHSKASTSSSSDPFSLFDSSDSSDGEDKGEKEEAEENVNDNNDSADDEDDEEESQDLFEFPIEGDDTESLQNDSDYSDDGEGKGENEEAEENANENNDSEDDEDDEEESKDLFEFPTKDDDTESLQNDSDYSDDGEGKVNEVESKDISEWNSDDDYSLNLEEDTDYTCGESLDFLGFHPYKEVIFLGRHFSAVAYHLGSSKAQYLGSFFPCRMISMLQGAQTLETFPYTPCLIDALPEPEK